MLANTARSQTYICARAMPRAKKGLRFERRRQGFASLGVINLCAEPSAGYTVLYAQEALTCWTAGPLLRGRDGLRVQDTHGTHQPCHPTG